MIDPNLGHASPCAIWNVDSLNCPVTYSSCGEEEVLELEDIVYDDRPGPEDILYCKELKALLFRVFRQLSPSQQRITYLHFKNGKNQVEIAQHLGVSRSAVSQALSKSILKMRQAVFLQAA
jgi:RNA polymerase sigma factor (sigma-70 family)